MATQAKVSIGDRVENFLEPLVTKKTSTQEAKVEKFALSFVKGVMAAGVSKAVTQAQTKVLLDSKVSGTLEAEDVKTTTVVAKEALRKVASSGNLARVVKTSAFNFPAPRAEETEGAAAGTLTATVNHSTRNRILTAALLGSALLVAGAAYYLGQGDNLQDLLVSVGLADAPVASVKNTLSNLWGLLA